MSRRDQWKSYRDSLTRPDKEQSVEERERVPEKACGLCEKFSESAYSSAGRGSCRVLKVGSDLSKTPPVLITEGENGLVCYFNTDGGACPHFTRMAFIDTDGSEVADPAFQRSHRQLGRLKP